MVDITMPHKIPEELYAPEKCPIHCNLRLNVTALSVCTRGETEIDANVASVTEVLQRFNLDRNWIYG